MRRRTIPRAAALPASPASLGAPGLDAADKPLVAGWDYLILTASNDAQAAAYAEQLRLRRWLGYLAGVREVLVVADPGGRRVGSGGSTVACLIEVLGRERGAGRSARSDPAAWENVLRRLRVLIIHAGGDARRLPAYGPCGKIFIPVPDGGNTPAGATLFDRQLPILLRMPAMGPGRGQIVIAAGDILVEFDPSAVRLAPGGVTGLGCRAAPELASGHGVYLADGDGRVRLFLQKPAPAEQADQGAVGCDGQSVLDTGTINFDAATAATLLRLLGVRPGPGGKLAWTGDMGKAIQVCELDFYREFCCAMGAEVTFPQYVASVRGRGSRWSEALLRRIFDALSPVPFHVAVAPGGRFRHFGTAEQIIASGTHLAQGGPATCVTETCLHINTDGRAGAKVAGGPVWVEGCRVGADLALGGRNLLVGVDVQRPLSLPPEACLDVLRGRSREGRSVCFVRCYSIRDKFKGAVGNGATFCGRPITEWLQAVGAAPEDVWDPHLPPDERTTWNARLFPAERRAAGYRRWLWMFDPAGASEAEHRAWRSASRYCHAEIAELADQAAFAARRARFLAEQSRRSFRGLFRRTALFSARELAYVLAHAGDRARSVAELLALAHRHASDEPAPEERDVFAFSRIAHSLGSAIEALRPRASATLAAVVPGLRGALAPDERRWLREIGLLPGPRTPVREWAARARALAFEHLRGAIVSTEAGAVEGRRSVLSSDQMVWGRAPARVDLAGAWTDTPPYALEYGGCVINAAVDLNGAPPIQAFLRIIDEPVIRIGSIDCGARVTLRRFEELLDYRCPTDGFAIAKAALVLSGFVPPKGKPPAGSLAPLLRKFGGGIELTTLAAIPKGTGLGTSSIMGAVILAVIQRATGLTRTAREIFHEVLRLEQALTTGGGWQDQVGGVVPGVKLITTAAGLVPDPAIRPVRGDLLDPKANGGVTLLYYTGLTRLAKNILQEIVGRYLDRDRLAMAALEQIHALPPCVLEAMEGKDLPALGRHLALGHRLNRQLSPHCTNETVEALLERIRPHVHGAKLTGAGGGGFLLIVCKSPRDAAALRAMLDADPPNERARFFDFDISCQGLVVTVC